MRELHVDVIVETVARLAVTANCRLPGDLYAALCARRATEPSPAGRDALAQLVENADIAAAANMPICQDTGFAVVFADVGQ
ncbi:MAG: fumarate hydratase, partial [Deltaproteobacteria bacterium]|nr:fumarate hydratase [Deltaproteobacteria bacterium]